MFKATSVRNILTSDAQSAPSLPNADVVIDEHRSGFSVSVEKDRWLFLRMQWVEELFPVSTRTLSRVKEALNPQI
jgi:hypothetical protein